MEELTDWSSVKSRKDVQFEQNYGFQVQLAIE